MQEQTDYSRQLRQWQAQNDEPISVEDWNNESKKSGLLYIVLKKCTQSIIILCDYLIQYISPPKKKAEEAIEVFKDELIWYFTEYVQRLDEVQNG